MSDPATSGGAEHGEGRSRGRQNAPHFCRPGKPMVQRGGLSISRRRECVRGQPDRIRLGGDEFAAEEEDLEPIEWWRWFQEFDRRNLQLVYDPSKGWFTLASRLAPSGG